MKRVFIIHGWDFNSKMNWYSWVKNELEKNEFKVYLPDMPNTSEPDIETWFKYLKNLVGTLDKDTYFIGYSIGCQTIMRYLEKENVKCGGGVFVAGWFNLDNLEDEEIKEIAEPWLKTKINFDKVKKNIGKLVVLLSKDDPYNFLEENKKIFQNKLNAEVILKENKGHYTEYDGVKKLLIVVDKLLEISRS